MPGGDLQLTHARSVEVGMLIRRPPGDVFQALVERPGSGLPRTAASLFAVRPSDGNGRCTAPGRRSGVKEIEDNSRILIDWGDDDETTTVEFRFVPYRDDATDVRVTETGHTGDGNEVAARAADSTGGFTFMVCALKALLEHDVVLTVVLDAHPQGLQL